MDPRTTAPLARLVALLVSVPLFFSSGGFAAVAPPELVHVVDVTSLSIEQLETIYALPEVEGWVEFGNTSVLVGTDRLEEALLRLHPRIPLRSVPGDRDDLVLTRFHAAPALELLLRDSELVAGFGRYAVVLAEPGSPAVLPHPSAHSTELFGMPWNTVVVRRPDRMQLPGAVHGVEAGLIEEAIGKIDAELFANVVVSLVSFGTRYTSVSSFPDVTDHVADRFAAIGLTPSLEAFQVSGKTRHNVIAELPGSVTPEDVYVICGHYDSTSQRPTSFAPGADDNASGAAGVLEMARVLSHFELDSTLRFIAFAGEEQGLVGSSAHVNKLKAQGQLGRVKGVINMDMIAYMNSPVMDVLIEGSASVSQPMMSLLSSLVTQHTSLVPFTSTNPFGSDHMPYINNGVNAVLTIEYQDWFNPNYHTTSDTFSTLTVPLAIEILKLNIAAISTVAGINGHSARGVVTRYGVGLGGSNTGTLDSSSIPNIGTTLVLELAGFDNSSVALVAISSGQANLPAYGGTLLVDFGAKIGMAAAAVTSGLGTVNLALPASASLVGMTGYLQAGAVDPTQPAGIAMSNGLVVTIGE